MGEVTDKMKKALQPEEDKNSSTASNQEEQPSTPDPGKGAGGAEDSPNATAAAEEVD